jgi:hypothetical protein
LGSKNNKSAWKKKEKNTGLDSWGRGGVEIW